MTSVSQVEPRSTLSLASAWPCDIPECTSGALIIAGDCNTCGRHLCGNHFVDTSVHDCLDLEPMVKIRRGIASDELRDAALFNDINIPKLAIEAATLRPGHNCSGPSNLIEDDTIFGHGSNFHIPFTFDDGKKWLVRIRRRRIFRPPASVLCANVRSEVATLKALSQRGLAVPMAWAAPDDSALPRDVNYFYTPFINGEPHPAFDKGLSDDPTTQTIKVIQSVARWFISLETVTYDLAGSLTLNDDGQVGVGPSIQIWPAFAEPPYFLGPFPSAKARYTSLLDTTLQQIILGIRYPPSQELFYYLGVLELKTLVENCDELERGPWYIKHGEDKGDHFLVDEERNLCGVIDWEWSFLTSKADAFAAPYGFTDSTFDSGSNILCKHEEVLVRVYEQELDRPDLAELVRNGKKYQRLCEFFIFNQMTVGNVNATRRAFLGLPDGIEGEPTTEKEWIDRALERYSGDEGLDIILARQK